MSEWKETTLGDVINLKRGYDLPESQRLEGSIPIYSSSGISGFQNSCKSLSPGVITGRYGTIGKVFISNTPFWSLNTTLYVQDFKSNDEVFIYYFLNKIDWTKFNDKSAVPGVNRNDLHQEDVLLPPLAEQKKIANILSCLDAKIDNLRQQNETLEEIARSIFKHWFIDFEFPNADGKPYKSSGGAMVRSDLGDIPEGWRAGKLGDYFTVKHGYAFKCEYITTEETNKILVTPGNFKIGGGFNDSKYKYYSDDNYSSEYDLKKKDLTVTMTDLSREGDTLGYPTFIPNLEDKVFLHNQRVGKIENSEFDMTFLYFLLCRREYRSHILGTSSGSTVRHTSPSRICDYIFVAPDFELVNNFSALATSAIDKILVNFEQIESLTNTRDALLPKLMSGQIRVKE